MAPILRCQLQHYEKLVRSHSSRHPHNCRTSLRVSKFCRENVDHTQGEVPSIPVGRPVQHGGTREGGGSRQETACSSAYAYQGEPVDTRRRPSSFRQVFRGHGYRSNLWNPHRRKQSRRHPRIDPLRCRRFANFHLGTRRLPRPDQEPPMGRRHQKSETGHAGRGSQRDPLAPRGVRLPKRSRRNLRNKTA